MQHATLLLLLLLLLRTHYVASRWGNAKVVEALLDAGADKELKNKYGKTALDYARSQNKGDVVAIVEQRR